MASTGSSVQAALEVLGDYSISYLMRSENYRTVETAVNGEMIMPVEQMQQLLKIFAHDLQQDTKYAASILKLLTVILKKTKLGEYPDLPELLTTATCVMNILSKTAPLHKVQSLQHLCLQVLLAYPDSLHEKLGSEHADDLLSLMDRYLSSTNVEPDIKAMMMDILLSVLNVLSADKRSSFVKEGLSVWFSRVVPLIFTSLPLREKAITATELLMPDLLTIDYSENPQWNTVFKNISDVDKYPAALKAMLVNGDESWHRAWCCVIQLLGTKLHKSANLINSLLAVLENAFKMNIPERCKAFHCWNYVIENFSLNMDQFFTSRKIRLLLIPLLVNNAKEETSASAKFETWWLLLRKLQSRIEPYLDTIVMKFLGYCFGQPRMGPNDKPPLPVLKFSKVQAMATQAIVEMVGHSSCSGCVSQDFIGLSQPMLNASNLVTHHTHWMHAITETTVMISKLKNEHAAQNVTCLWFSLFKYLNEIEDDTKQEIVFKEFVQVLSDLVQASSQNESLATLIGNTVFPIIFDQQSGLLQLVDKHRSSEETSLTHICKLALCPYFKTSYSACANPSVKEKRLRAVTDTGTKHSNSFSKWLLQELSTEEHSLAWWISLVDSIVENQCYVPEDIAKYILIWPITKMEYFTEVDQAAECWAKMYTNIAPRLVESQLYFEICNILLLHYESMATANKFAVRILPLTISSILENDLSKVVSMVKELSILSELTGRIRELSNCNENATVETLKCLSHVFKALSIDSVDSTAVAQYTVKAANNILKCLLAHHNSQVTSEVLLEFMNSVKIFFLNKNNINLAADLAETLSECLKRDNSIMRKTSLKIIDDLISNGFQSDYFSTINRPRMASHHAGNQVNKSTDKLLTPKNKLDTPKKPKNNSKIVKKVVEGNEEFVVVKSNWKFNPNNLTDHQRHVLKKKREDIPALYQDLSQSQDDIKMKTWKMPGYKSDSQDVSTSINGFHENDPTTNILKDIPNPEIGPNVITKIIKGDDFKDVDNQTFKGKLEIMKENSELKQPIQKQKNVQPKSPRISLMDKVSKSVQNLLGKNFDNNSVSATTDLSSPTNKTVNVKCLQTPKQTVKSSEDVAFSAPPKLDSERPSRVKRKPKKLESDFEIPDFTKRKRNSMDPEISSCKNSKEHDDTFENGKNKLENFDETIEKNYSSVSDAANETNNETTLNSVTIALQSEVLEEKVENPTEMKVLPEKPNTLNTKCIDCTPKSAVKSKNSIKDGKLSTKKKNRLELQLAIDTVEGHPLLTPKDESRITRKSRALNETVMSGKRSGTDRSTKEKSTIPMDSTPKAKNRKENESENSNPSNEGKNYANIDDKSVDLKLSKTNTLVVGVDLASSEDFIESSQESPLPSIHIKSSRQSIHKKSARKALEPTYKSSDSGSTSDSESDPGVVSKPNDDSNVCTKEPVIISNTDASTKTTLVDFGYDIDAGIDNINATDITPCQENESSDAKSVPVTNQQLMTPADSEVKNSIDTSTEEMLCNEELTTRTNTSIKDVKKVSMDVEENTFSDETIAELDTQPVSDNNTKPSFPIKGHLIEPNDTVTREDNHSPEDTHLSYAKIGGKPEINTLSDETIAEMDTEPFVAKPDVGKCLGDIIIIDDNSCDVEVLATINIDSETEAVAKTNEPAGYSSVLEPEICKPLFCELSTETGAAQEHSPIQSMVSSPNTQPSVEESIDPLNISGTKALCSPIKDSEKRNNEFLNNTLEISPIRILSPKDREPSPVADENSNDYVVISLVSPIKTTKEPDKSVSPEIFTNDKPSPDKIDLSPPRNEAISSTESPSSLSLKKNRSQVRQSGRGAQMLDLCSPGNFSSKLEKSDQSLESEETKRTPVITPAKKNLRIAYADSEATVNNQAGNFLCFKKTLPSASSSPACPILKRKFADIMDDSMLSPACKRKRVSFHDPPVSTTVSVEKYIEDSCIRSPQQSHNKNKDRKSRPLSAKSLVKKLDTEYPESAQNTAAELSNTEAEESEMDDIEMNSMQETPQAEILNRDALNATEAIYPDLVDCSDPIAVITEELTTESMRELFLNEMGTITTIGELAKLTELEVNRLNVKSPKIATVKKVLANYSTKKLRASKPTPPGIENIDVEIQTEFEEEFWWNTLNERTSKEVIEACLEKKSDFIEEFSSVISKEAKEKMTYELPANVIGNILCERLNDTSIKDADEILATLVQKHPQQFLNKTFQELGPDNISEKLGLESIEEYLLKKLTPGDLVKFCSTLLQKKIPCEK